MNKILLVILLMIGCSLSGFSTATLEESIQFARLDKAKQLLSQEDEFTESWSQFDIDSRCGKQNSTKEELFKLITENAREWTSEEKEKINAILKKIDSLIKEQAYQIAIPKEVFLVKTTGAEEGGAEGYTRAKYIVLKNNILSKPEDMLQSLIVHELFHVLSRNNPEFRQDMYEIIGFRMMPKIDYPDKIRNLRITNPDAPQTDSYISLMVDSQKVNCMMVLYAKGDYEGGSFFQYLQVGFLELEGDSIKTAAIKDKEPSIYPLIDVKGFFEQIGNNTQYIIHPEEIMAENFVLAIYNSEGLKDQEIVDKIKRKLKP